MRLPYRTIPFFVIFSFLLLEGCVKHQDLAVALSTKTGSAIADSTVLTPAGWLPRSHAHLIEPGFHLRVVDGHVWKVHTLTGKLTEDFGPKGQSGTLTAPPGARVVTGNGGKPGPVFPGTNPNWFTWSYWNLPSGQAPINSFSTTWTVPNLPTTDHGQTLYIFNGMSQQDESEIIQPVLQYGPSYAGGGAHAWNVANWYVWSNANGVTEAAVQMPLEPVAPGTALTGVITLNGQTGGDFRYTSSFTGIPNPLNVFDGANVNKSTAQIPFVNQQTWLFETLEAYGAGGNGTFPAYSTDFPPDQDVRMTNIITTNSGLTWTAASSPAASQFGQHTVVVNNYSQGGEVDIYFHPLFININGNASYDWYSSGTGSGTIVAPPGTRVAVTISAYGSSSGSHLTNFMMSGAQLSGPMGNNVYVSNGSTTQYFTMPASGSVTWSGYFSENDNTGSGHISVAQG